MPLELRVRDVFRFSDGRSVFVGPIQAGPPVVRAAVCDVVVDGEVTGHVEVSEELPTRREPSTDRSLGTYSDAAVTPERIRKHDVRLPER
jgi:hypothetical protein